MRFQVIILVVGVSFFLNGVASPHSSVQKLSLEDAESLALQHSPDAKLANSYIESLEQKIRSVKSGYYPKLVLEGSYRYVDVIPALATQMGTVSLGDNKNYSVGPALLMNLFDGGMVSNTVDSLKQMKEAKISEKEYIEVMTRLATRLAYLNVLVAIEQYQLAQESLKLSSAQNRDIKRKRKLGALSQLDLSLSNRDFLNQKLKVIDAKKTLEVAIIEFSSLLAKDPQAIILYVPTDTLSLNGTPMQFDSLDVILKSLEKKISPGTQKPAQVVSIEKKIESAKEEVQIENSKYWPKISLKLKTSLDYPNGPQLQQIHQNTIGVNLTMPIYDWGERSGARSEKKARIAGLQAQKDKLERDIYRNREKLKLELENLKEQAGLVESLLQEANRVARINLSSFRSGRIQFTEVERANVKKFETQVRKLILKGQIFAKLSQIAAISKGGI
ncbi:MAG: TolC family protein [Bdellovibrionales bacterium]|nr:TolC family protein [Bdellovibrionales bacterium]